MKPIERFQALLDGKKIKCVLNNHRYIELLENRHLVDEYGAEHLGNYFELFDPKREWELYEEPKPEIKLTPEMVGKRVRLRFGGMEVLTRYNPRACEDSQYETTDTYYSENGRVMESSESDTDIVEVYP